MSLSIDHQGEMKRSLLTEAYEVLSEELADVLARGNWITQEKMANKMIEIARERRMQHIPAVGALKVWLSKLDGKVKRSHGLYDASQPKERPTLDPAVKQVWALRFQAAIERILAAGQAVTRTAIVREARGDDRFDLVYDILKAFSNDELYELGFPRPGEHAAKNGESGSGSNGNGKGDTRLRKRRGTADSASSKSHEEQMAESAKNAEERINAIKDEIRVQIESLPQGRRSVADLAELRGKPTWQVETFLSRNPELREMLDS